ncbi:MAG: hypothetical protein ACI4R9_00695 [Kiritimatiellia bacterium]
MNAKTIVASVSIGCALLTGCLQMQLQSNDEQERMAALAQLSDSDLENVILGRPLEKGSPLYQQRGDVTYPDDVKIGAIDKLYEKGKVEKLIGLADDYRIGGGKMAMIHGETPTTKAIKEKFRTPKGLEQLCAACEDGSSSAERMLSGMWKNSGDDFFLWVIQNEERKALKNTFEKEWNDRVGQKAVARINSADVLASIAQGGSFKMGTRVAAAKRLFGVGGVKGDVVQSTVASFDGSKDSVIVEVADCGIACAKRIGATDVAQSLEAKYSTRIKDKEEKEQKEAARSKFWDNVGLLQSFFVESRRNVRKGDIFRVASSLDLSIAWAPEYSCCDSSVVVKQVISDGVVVGCIKEYQRVKTGNMSDRLRTPVYKEFRFPNRIIVKTDKQFADGDAFDIPYLKYIGTTTCKRANGSTVTLHTFEPYQIPEEMK